MAKRIITHRVEIAELVFCEDDPIDVRWVGDPGLCVEIVNRHDVSDEFKIDRTLCVNCSKLDTLIDLHAKLGQLIEDYTRGLKPWKVDDKGRLVTEDI